MGRVARVGLFAAVVAGGYVLWQKRFDIQRGLEALGIKTPLFKRNLVEVARSVAAKASGKFEHEYPKANVR